MRDVNRQTVALLRLAPLRSDRQSMISARTDGEPILVDLPTAPSGNQRYRDINTMAEPSNGRDDALEVSGNIARLAELLRIAAETTRLLAASAGSREPVIRTLATQLDDVADALSVVGLVDLDGGDPRRNL